MPTKSRENQLGYTLVELLIVIAIFSMLSAIVFSSIKLGIKTLEQIVLNQYGIDDVQLTRKSLTNWIANVYPKYTPATTSDFSGHIDFDGEPTAMTFLTKAPETVARGGMVFMQLKALIGGSGSSLVVVEYLELSRPDQKRELTETLMGGLAGARFSYWGSDGLDGPSYWHPTWVNRLHLPEAINFKITMRSGDKRKWPDLIVAPSIYEDEGCQLLVGSQSCFGR